MISTDLLSPSAANDLRAKRARKRTAKDVFPDLLSNASAREDNEEGSSIVIVKQHAKSLRANLNPGNSRKLRPECRLIYANPSFRQLKFSLPFFMGHRIQRLSTFLHVPLMSPSQEATKQPFKPSQNWLTIQKTLPQDPTSKKRKRRQLASKTPSSSRSFSSAARPPPKLTSYNPWEPSASQRRQQGNPALILQPKSSSKIDTYSLSMGYELIGLCGQVCCD